MPSVSQAQQRFMGMVHAEKEGKLDKSKLDPEFAAKIERIAARIKAKAARDFAETKHKNLPKKKKSKKNTSPPEGDSRGQNKKAEYIMSKLANKRKEGVYPKDIKQTPSPHLFWKPLMRKISPWKDWGDDAVNTPGVGAFIERVLPFGNSGRHWKIEKNETMTKVPGIKGTLQRVLPGGQTGFKLEKKAGKAKAIYNLAKRITGYGDEVATTVKKTTKPSVIEKTEKVIKPKVKTGFSVKPYGDGSGYDAYLGSNRIGFMNINPRTSMVEHVEILKPFRRSGFGTKFYNNVIGHRGGLYMNPDTKVPSSLAIWSKLRKTFPPIYNPAEGLSGVKKVEGFPYRLYK